MTRKTKELRITKLEEFLRKVDSCKGKFSARKKRELGKHFLEVVIGLEDKFIACKPGNELPDFEPHDEELYPWALFVTDEKDLREEYDHRASSYLHPDKVGKEFHAVITNCKELCVFDFKHEVAKYTVLFAELLDSKAKAVKHWQAFLTDFGVESAKERRKGVIDLPVSKKKPPTIKINLQHNSIVCGDCINWLGDIPPESIDMCYIDPPFFANSERKIIWGNGYERRAYEDRWKGGIRAYIEWMEKRVRLIHRCLKDTGSIFLHCDWHASHRLRVMLDKVFGDKNFVNEIIWCYTGPSNTTKFFPRKHDNILFYSKSDKHTFNIREARVPHKRQKPSTGKGMASGKRSIEEIKILEIESLKIGKVVEDHWNDIPSGSHIPRKERIGYKTQKPEKLLERIIKCSTNEGDVVLDCFGGGGTTAVVAAKLNRKFITGDVSPVAVRVISDRLKKITDVPNFEVLNVPRTAEEWLKMDGHTFAEKICAFMGWECNPKKSGDGGVDGWTNNGTVPIQIKNHRKSIGVNPIKNFYASLDKAKVGIFAAWSFSKNAEEYRAKVQSEEGKEIRFVTVEEILGSIMINDEEKDKLDKLYSKYDKAS